MKVSLVSKKPKKINLTSCTLGDSFGNIFVNRFYTGIQVGKDTKPILLLIRDVVYYRA